MRRLLLVLVAVTSLVGCGGDGVVGGVDPMADPLDVLAPCDGAPGPAIELDTDLVLPESTLVLERTTQDPLTYLTGYVGMTPGEIRELYEASTEVELLISEDEIFEVELLFTDGTQRAYLKGRAVCRTGTSLTIVVAAELEGALDLVPDGAFQAGSS